MKNSGVYISLVALVASMLATIFIFLGENNQVVYVSSPKLFEAFEGTKELSKKLDDLRIGQQQVLDSLEQLAKAYQEQQQLQEYGETVNRLREAEQLFASEEQSRSNEYTEQIWKQLNQYTQEYGESKGYDYILGANSNGSIMFAKKSNDITDEVLEYANRKYAGRD